MEYGGTAESDAAIPLQSRRRHQPEPMIPTTDDAEVETLVANAIETAHDYKKHGWDDRAGERRMRAPGAQADRARAARGMRM